MSLINADIERLIEQAKKKDPVALDAIYRMYFPKMMGVCIKIVKEDKDMAKDLVHDAFVLAFASLDKLRNPERLGEWLTTIMRNVSLKYIERKDQVRHVPIDAISDKDSMWADTAASPEAIVNHQELLGLISQLPQGYGQVFRLFVIEGFSHKEIAEMLGIEPHSSSSQLSRAKSMLRKMIGYGALAVLLLGIVMLPVYLLLMRGKNSPMEDVVIAEKKTIPKRKKKMIKPKQDIVSPIYEESIPESRVESVVSDTMQVSDILHDEEEMTERYVAEAPQDSDTHITSDSIIQKPVIPTEYLAEKTDKKKKNKWQMLAAGSLGSSLIQNVDKLLATRGDDGCTSDDQSSVFPEYVYTWEEYTQYLSQHNNEYSPADTLIMSIAKHNSGNIIEREEHSKPITFGLSFNKSLTDKWSVETGIQYSLLNSTFTLGSNGYYISRNQSIHYLGIPLHGSYRLTNYKGLSTYGTAGMTLHLPVYGKNRSNYVVGDITAYAESYTFTPPIQVATTLGLGLQYTFLRNVSLYAEPTLNWYIPNGSSTHTVWSEHPVVFSVPFGIRITW